jgi:DNA-binding response OmpR family regulator
LLVVEDDKDLNRQIFTALTRAGYAVDRAFDGEEGWFLGDTEPYDAVVLDLGLPGRPRDAGVDFDCARPVERQGSGVRRRG